MRKQSKSAKHAENLIKRFELPFIENDGAPNQEDILFRDDKLGISIIKDGTLYGNPNLQNFTRTQPDYRNRVQSTFIEVKDNILYENWNRLEKTRNALDDNFRISLIRIKVGAVKDISLDFNELEETEKKMISNVLAGKPRSRPEDRRYIRWTELIIIIQSPQDNFQLVNLTFGNRDLPFRLVAGTANSKQPLYIIDDKIMDIWEQI